MKISDYTKPELDRFRELCNFTSDETLYFNYRSQDTSNKNIAELMCVSDTKVSILARKVKDKIRRIEMMDKKNEVENEEVKEMDST